MKKNIWYIGYLVAFVLLATLITVDLSKPLEIIISLLFSSIFSITYVMRNHNKKVKKDKAYRIAVNDERNIAIKEKTGNAIAPIYMLLFGIQAIYGLAYDMYDIAIFNGAIVFLSPVVMILISRHFEKKVL